MFKGVANQHLWKAERGETPHEGKSMWSKWGWGQERCEERWGRDLSRRCTLNESVINPRRRASYLPSFPWSFPVSPSSFCLYSDSALLLLWGKRRARTSRAAFWAALPREQAGRQPQLWCACVARGLRAQGGPKPDYVEWEPAPPGREPRRCELTKTK